MDDNPDGAAGGHFGGSGIFAKSTALSPKLRMARLSAINLP